LNSRASSNGIIRIPWVAFRGLLWVKSNITVPKRLGLLSLELLQKSTENTPTREALLNLY
jgi:hypothetical protein